MKQAPYRYIGQHVYDFASKFNADVEIRRTSGQPTLELSAWSATATAAHAGRIKFLKSGTAAYDTLTAGDHTTAGEILGRIEAYGIDDGDGETLSSYIEFANDAISDADSSPGIIRFATSDGDDAGTPTISDPGLILLKECIKKKIKIFPIPGVSAVTTAMSISSFDEKYFFYGFLPKRIKELEKNDS